MQNLKYYVLWRKNSPLIAEYKEKFYKKLIQLLEWYIATKLIEWNITKILEKKDSKSFILNTDISSLICYIEYQQSNNEIDEVNKTANILQKEIQCFLEKGIDSKQLTMNA